MAWPCLAGRQERINGLHLKYWYYLCGPEAGVAQEELCGVLEAIGGCHGGPTSG